MTRISPQPLPLHYPSGMTTVSQTIKFRSATSRYQAAVIAAVESGDTCTIIVLGDGSPWEDSAPAFVLARIYTGVAKGTAVGEWQPAVVDEQTEEAITVAIAAIPGVDLSGVCAVPGAGSSQVSLGLDAARRPSTTRPTRVTATGSMTLASTLLGAQSASVDFRSDSSSTPTTSRGQAPSALSGVAATVTVPWALSYDVPAGDYYMLVTAHSANASVALSTLNETEL